MKGFSRRGIGAKVKMISVVMVLAWPWFFWVAVDGNAVVFVKLFV